MTTTSHHKFHVEFFKHFQKSWGKIIILNSQKSTHTWSIGCCRDCDGDHVIHVIFFFFFDPIQYVLSPLLDGVTKKKKKALWFGLCGEINQSSFKIPPTNVRSWRGKKTTTTKTRGPQKKIDKRKAPCTYSYLVPLPVSLQYGIQANSKLSVAYLVEQWLRTITLVIRLISISPKG